MSWSWGFIADPDLSNLADDERPQRPWRPDPITCGLIVGFIGVALSVFLVLVLPGVVYKYVGLAVVGFALGWYSAGLGIRIGERWEKR